MCKLQKSVEPMAKIGEKNFCEYRKSGDRYEPIGDTIERLPSGFYKPYHDSYNDKYYFVTKNIIMPKLYAFENDIQKAIMDDIKRFWNSEERYRRFGSVYKRNILLYSLPGNGKTSVINLLCQDLIREHDGIIVYIDSNKELHSYSDCMQRFKAIEPNRNVITIIEDFERLAEDKDNAALLLQMLDGNEQVDNVVTIATTNYPEILEKRFVCRPSRFNLVIEYGKPNEDTRRQYITMKLQDGGIDVNDSNVKEDIERLVRKTDNYTFDFLKEAVQGIYVDDLTEDAVFERLNEIIERNGKYQVKEEAPTKIGFSNLGHVSDDRPMKSTQKSPNEYDEDDMMDFELEACFGAENKNPLNINVKKSIGLT